MNGTVKAFSIVTVFSVATRLFSFLFKIWMSRTLGAEAVGLYQIALSVLLLLFSFTAGAPTVLSRKVAECAARGDVRRQNALTTASLVIGLVTSAAMCAVFLALRDRLGGLFADERCVPIFLVMLPALVTSSLYAPLRSWFWGRKRFLAFSSLELVDEVLKIGFAMLFAGGLFASMTGAVGVAAALTVSDAASVLILFFMFFRAGGRLRRPQGTGELVSATLPLSAVRVLTSLSASLSALVIPRKLVEGGMTAAAAAAGYGRVAGMALPLIMAPVTVISALSVVLIPDLAELAAAGRYDDIRAKLRTALLFAAIVASAFFAAYVPLGKELGLFFFGDEEAGRLVSYAAVIIFPLALGSVTTPVLNSLGMEKCSFAGYVCGLVCSLPCIFLLPQCVGIYSAAVASGVGMAVTASVNSAFLMHRLGRPEGTAKAVGVCVFSLPLAVLGCFLERLVAPALGTVLTMLAVTLPVLGLFAAFVSVFGVVDIRAVIRMLLPAKKPRICLRHRRSRAERSPSPSE